MTIERGDPETARALHTAAHEKCFIANSLSTPVLCEPTIVAGLRPTASAPA